MNRDGWIRSCVRRQLRRRMAANHRLVVYRVAETGHYYAADYERDYEVAELHNARPRTPKRQPASDFPLLSPWSPE